MDTLGAVLREFGKGAFDVEGLRAATLRKDCDRWAEHVLLGGRRPTDTEMRGPLPVERRDFAGVRRFFTERRAAESAAVTRSLGALQQSLWASLKTLDGVVAGYDDADGEVGVEMDRLHQIARTGSSEMIRREVLNAVSQMEQIARDKTRPQEQAFADLKTKVEALGQELEIAWQENWQENSMDPLTRLYNCRPFDERCGQVMATRRLFGEPSATLFVDLDHFKSINDTLGHVVGNMVLREVANVLARSFLSRSDFVGRYSGEGFVVVLWGAGLDRATPAADRLVDAVGRHVILNEGKRAEITISAGVAELLAGEDIPAWIARTDRALYAAKRAGRNRAASA